MKGFVVFLIFLSVSVVAHPQLPAMHITRHRWAGGTCCSGGTNYSCTITFPAKDFACFDSLQLLIDGFSVTVPDYRMTKTFWGDSLVMFSYAFGSRSSMRYNDKTYETTWYGLIPGEVPERKDTEQDGFVLIRPESRERGTDIRFTDRMTAYP